MHKKQRRQKGHATKNGQKQNGFKNRLKRILVKGNCFLRLDNCMIHLHTFFQRKKNMTTTPPKQLAKYKDRSFSSSSSASSSASSSDRIREARQQRQALFAKNRARTYDEDEDDDWDSKESVPADLLQCVLSPQLEKWWKETDWKIMVDWMTTTSRFWLQCRLCIAFRPFRKQCPKWFEELPQHFQKQPLPVMQLILQMVDIQCTFLSNAHESRYLPKEGSVLLDNHLCQHQECFQDSFLTPEELKFLLQFIYQIVQRNPGFCILSTCQCLEHVLQCPKIAQTLLQQPHTATLASVYLDYLCKQQPSYKPKPLAPCTCPLDVSKSSPESGCFNIYRCPVDVSCTFPFFLALPPAYWFEHLKHEQVFALTQMLVNLALHVAIIYMPRMLPLLELILKRHNEMLLKSSLKMEIFHVLIHWIAAATSETVFVRLQPWVQCFVPDKSTLEVRTHWIQILAQSTRAQDAFFQKLSAYFSQ